jgi:hypothetical protein
MKLYKVYEVLADISGDGPACDGTKVFRFKRQAEANAFAARNTCYQRPCKVSEVEVSKRLMDRWF